MPLIEVSIAEGRTEGELRNFITALHKAAETTVHALPENTTVIVREVPKNRWSKGNATIAERG